MSGYRWIWTHIDEDKENPISGDIKSLKVLGVPGKKGSKKLEKKLLLSFDQTLFDELRAVANANHTSEQDLLRHAARALVRRHLETGREQDTIPIPMQIVPLITRAHLGKATEEELGQIIEERLRHAKFEVNEAGQLAAELAAELARGGAKGRKG